MKALRFYGRRDIRYEDIPEPSFGPGQVKIKVALAGICGSDLRRYSSGPYAREQGKVPYTPGHELAGTVVALGEGVTDFSIGQRVSGIGSRYCGRCFFCLKGLYNLCPNNAHYGNTADGCMAEYMIAPGNALFKLPDSVSDEAGAQIEPLSVAMHAVNRGNVKLGDKVVIIGDGAIGLYALLFARTAGASEVYMVAKHKGRGLIAQSIGATAVVYVNEEDPVKAILGVTNTIGADVSIECVGNLDTPQLAVNLIRRGGTAVILGSFETPSSFNFGTIGYSDKSIVGSSLFANEPKVVIALLANGRIDPGYVVTGKVPLENAVAMGFEKLITNKEENIKILLKIP
jgi:(R,R)-butanediol dehydrogenase/meso-butanediol dehydrogenase/diacetyl reductase